MKKIAIFVMIATIVSKISGFFRDIILAYFYGASNISDAYIISLTIPTVLFSLVAFGISTGYIPVCSSIVKEKSEEESLSFTNNIINIMIIFCLAMSLLGMIYTKEIVKMFAIGFDEETSYLAVYFTRISIFSIVFILLRSLLTSYVQLRNKFYIASLIGIPYNLMLILFIFLSSIKHVELLPLGILFGSIVQFVILILYSFKNGYRYKAIINLKDENVKRMIFLAFPLFVGVAVNQLNILIDKTIASSIVVGGISSLTYANRLTEFAIGIFVIPIGTVIFPIASKMFADEDIEAIKELLVNGILGILILLIPAVFGLMIFSDEIISLLFGRGAFDKIGVQMSASALFFYTLGVVPLSLRDLLAKIFYSLHDTKTPAINASIGVGVNIILNFLLAKLMGLSGLALATSISASLIFLLMYISLKKRIGDIGIRNEWKNILKIICASIIMILSAFIINKMLIDIINVSLALLISIAIAVMIYILAIIVLKVNFVLIILKSLKHKYLKGTEDEGSII